LEPQQQVFVVGFPYKISSEPKLTIKSGVIAPLEFLLQGKTLVEGYKIGYDIEVQPGTSGGPIIDTVGEVVGVNGRSKSVESPFANAPDPYTFTDNTQPDKNIKLLMRYFAWGIPIETYINLDNNINLPRASTAEPSLSKNLQRNYDTNPQAQLIAPNNTLIQNIILISIFGLIIIIACFLFNQWYKDKKENQQRFKAIEDKQKDQESNLCSEKEEIKTEIKVINNALSSQKIEINLQQQKVTEQEQTLSTLEGNLQQFIKVLRENKDEVHNLQNSSSTEEQDK
jgi:hypothetical protein